MYCPNCLAEYRAGFTRCSDCEVPLVAALPESSLVQPVPPDPVHANPKCSVDLITVLECPDSVAYSLARAALEEAGIPYTINDLAYGMHMLDYDSCADVPCRFQVAKEDEREARTLLAPLTLS